MEAQGITESVIKAVVEKSYIASYTYDANGNRTSTTYPNGVVTTYEYNSINALVRQVSRDSDNNILTSFEYTIGANGERTSVTELKMKSKIILKIQSRMVIEAII